MAGKIGHKVVVDINLTSVDVNDESDSDEEEIIDEEDLIEDDEEMVSDNEEDLREEMEMSEVKGKQKGRKMSKVSRPVRERKPKQLFQCSNLRWTYQERQQLLKALKKHPTSAIDLIQADVPSKTKLQIKDFMNKINKSIQWKSDNPIPVMDWTNMARDLVRTEKKDYTDSLPRAMSIISSFENHPKPANRVPDYSAIYKYLALVLEGKELPILGPLESAVMLDLLHGMVDKVAMSDTKRQRQVMKWKYKLLSSKVDTFQYQVFLKQARKALANDFTEFENESNASVKQEPGCSNSSTNQTAQPSSSHLRTNGPADTDTAASSSTTSDQSTSASSSRSHTTTGTTGISATLTPKKSLGPPKKRHKNTGKEVRTETSINSDSDDYRVGSKKEPKQVVDREAIQAENSIDGVDSKTSPPVKRKRTNPTGTETHPQPDSSVCHKDNENTNSGADVSADSERTLSQNVGHPESTGESCPTESTEHHTKSLPSGKKKKAIGRPRKGVFKVQEDSPGDDSMGALQDLYGRGPGRPFGCKKIFPKKVEKFHEDPSEIPKKPSLYTLNPFCVPVSLLPLRSKPLLKSLHKVVSKDPLPAIISKKHGPLFNKQKNEGITSVSIHRMAAVIPVSKQHILLPNSGTQKSLS